VHVKHRWQVRCELEVFVPERKSRNYAGRRGSEWLPPAAVPPCLQHEMHCQELGGSPDRVTADAVRDASVSLDAGSVPIRADAAGTLPGAAGVAGAGSRSASREFGPAYPQQSLGAHTAELRPTSAFASASQPLCVQALFFKKKCAKPFRRWVFGSKLERTRGVAALQPFARTVWCRELNYLSV
jgi:hypothetical protein